MGVNIYLLDRRPATLHVGGTRQIVGTLRRFFKLTELDDERCAEVNAAAMIKPSPLATLLPDAFELPIANKAFSPVTAHMVLGWDAGRGSVTDYKWDFLPLLGYAVRDPATHEFTLYEERDGYLHYIDAVRAYNLSLVDANSRLVPHGQPLITACDNVRPYLDQYVAADCTLSTGDTETLIVRIDGDELPLAQWFVGKRPMDVKRYQQSLKT